MSHRRFPSSLFLLPIILVLQAMLGIPQSLGNTGQFEKCRDARFKCGQLSAGYPFSGPGIPPACGHPGLQLDCENDHTPTIDIVGVRYVVQEINPDRQKLRIARQDLIENDLCDPEFINSTVNYKLFDLVNAPLYANVTLLYGCPKTVTGSFGCTVNRTGDKDVWLRSEDIDSELCSNNVTFPILRSSLGEIFNFSLLLDGIEKGFEVKWKQDSQACQRCKETGGACGFNWANQTICYCPDAKTAWQETTECPRLTPVASPAWFANESLCDSCKNSHGQCGYNHTSSEFICYCSGRPYSDICPTTKSSPGSNSKLKLIIGLTVGVTSAIVVLCTICFVILRFKGESTSNNASVEEFIKKFGSLAPRRYFYADIKKMTNKFKDKLGQGGYGSVYKGKLPDGRLVAVKVLSESKGNGEDFMNEVASISRTSHVNIVTLLGFCYDKSKRALVYEFMPHGSLDKFIYNQRSRDQSRQLEWKTLYDIAVGIARGLEYLHQGCNTRILHFDIKPHNILLDESFCPKISDFGLSKLCERKESMVSMTGARGTAGYIAPEVFCRNFGAVSHKSDVYSYGMMVLEMVGGRKNIDVEVSQTSEVYFPSWIYKNLDQAMNLSLNGVTAEEDEEITRKLILVSLWCIQSNPADRPSMTNVLHMLQGSLQSLEIPPRPFVSSPVRSPRTASTR